MTRNQSEQENKPLESPESDDGVFRVERLTTDVRRS